MTHPLRRRLCLLVLLGVVTAWFPQPGHAQDAPRYDFVLRGVSLDDALRQLINTTRLDLAFDPTLTADKRAYCIAEQQSAEDILRCILEGTGLEFYRLSSGLYVLTEGAETPPLYGNLQGIVVDQDTGEPLPYAHILLADGAMGAVSNETGRFHFADLKPGYYRLTTSYLGYQHRVDSVWVSPNNTVEAHVPLASDPIVVAPIVIDGMQWRLLSDSLGLASASQQDLLRTPNRGLPDVVRSLGSLVGVRLSDATADLHIQGGEAGEHQFRLDGAPVFIPVSIGGLVGPFSPFAVGRVTVHKTGFGAALGSQSSGVVQIEHALGQAAPQALDVQVDPLSLNARLGLGFGPNRSRTSLLLAGRFGLWDVYEPPPMRELLDDWNQADPFMMAAFGTQNLPEKASAPLLFQRSFLTGNPGIGFYDAHAAARFRFGTLHSLHVSTYWGRRELDSDRARIPFSERALAADVNAPPTTRDLFVWDNSTTQLRLESVLSPRVLASLRGRASLYRLRHDFALVESIQEEDGTAISRVNLAFEDNGNRIQEYAVEARLDWAVQDRWHLEAGVEPTYTLSRFLIQGTQLFPISHQSSGWRVASFLTNRFTLSRRLTADVGTRLTYLAARQQAYAEPRLALRYDHPGGRLGPWSFRLASGLYRQFVNQFDVSSRSARGLSATSRAWLAIDSTVSPPHAAHLAAEWLWQPRPGWTFRLEGYYKRHLHLLAVDYAAHPPEIVREGPDDAHTVPGAEFSESDLPLPSSSQDSFLADGSGRAYGATVVIEKRLRGLRLEARYEYSRAQRSFPLFYDGDTVPAPWDEPHRLELAVDWMPFKNMTLLGRWRGIWGRSWGFRQSYYDFLGAARSVVHAIPENIQDIMIDQIIAYRLRRPQRHRLPPVYQLDLSAAYTLHLGGLRLQTRLDLLNVLDQSNVADWRFIYDQDFYRGHRLLKRDDRLLLPFTPSLALRMSW